VRYYLGIDGGGTKTTCAVGDETSILATAESGPSNVIRVGESRARESLQQSVRQACAAAGITPAEITQTCVGASGAARPEVAARIRSFLAEIIPTPIEVVGDMHIALEAAFHTSAAVAVIAGTGSIAYTRDREGSVVRAGGWGFAIGDEGSAHWIGRTAVSAILRASDRSEVPPGEFVQSPMASALCKAWGVSSLNDLALAANSIPPPDFAALSHAVFASEDEIAMQVLSSAARELAEIAAVVVGRLCAREHHEAVPVAMTGGVFRHSLVVREAFYNELRKMESRAQVLSQVVDPVEGALRVARRAALKKV
jgi:N-acetylglucosamine kinase-like BadF-type ATPase